MLVVGKRVCTGSGLEFTGSGSDSRENPDTKQIFYFFLAILINKNVIKTSRYKHKNIKSIYINTTMTLDSRKILIQMLRPISDPDLKLCL